MNSWQTYIFYASLTCFVTIVLAICIKVVNLINVKGIVSHTKALIPLVSEAPKKSAAQIAKCLIKLC